MVEKKPELPDARKKELLQQSLKVMPLVENVNGTPDASAPEGWRLVAASDPPGKNGTQDLYAKIYERIGPVPAGEKKYAVAFRGTDKLTDHGDLDADLGIAFRKLPNQYWEALDFIEAACKENNINPSDMLYTGHSLGGYLARTVGTTLGARSIWTFNSPGPTEKIRNELGQFIPGLSAPPGDGLVQIRSSNDLVSAWGYKEGITVEVKTQGNHHGLAGLRQAVDDTLAGRAPTPAPRQKLSLSSVFNEVAKRMANSPVVHNLIERLVDNDDAPSRAKAAARPPAIT